MLVSEVGVSVSIEQGFDQVALALVAGQVEGRNTSRGSCVRVSFVTEQELQQGCMVGLDGTLHRR